MTIETQTINENIDWLTDTIASGATFFVGHSGGKDSQALSAVIESWVPANQIVYVHADLGDVEWAGIKDHIRANLPTGAELEVVKAQYKDGTPNTLHHRIEKRAKQVAHKTNFWPTQGQRYCTGELKVGPIWKLIRNHPKAQPKYPGHRPVVVNCVGIRGEEGDRRNNLPPLSINKANHNSVREAYDFFPLHDIKVERVWKIIAESGQTRHPAYDQGNERLSCMFCVFGSRNDWRNAKQHRPDQFQALCDLETKYGRTLHSGRSITEWLNEPGK